jgi:hypothetical protein
MLKMRVVVMLKKVRMINVAVGDKKYAKDVV